MNSAGQFQTNQITITEIHTNTSLTLIQVTEDKLRLVLISHQSALQEKSRWQVPLGILLTLITVFLTSDFKDFATIDKSTWRAFFMLLSAASFVWLIATLKYAFTSVTLEGLMEKIKNVAKPDA